MKAAAWSSCSSRCSSSLAVEIGIRNQGDCQRGCHEHKTENINTPCRHLAGPARRPDPASTHQCRRGGMGKRRLEPRLPPMEGGSRPRPALLGYLPLRPRLRRGRPQDRTERLQRAARRRRPLGPHRTYRRLHRREVQRPHQRHPHPRPRLALRGLCRRVRRWSLEGRYPPTASEEWTSIGDNLPNPSVRAPVGLTPQSQHARRRHRRLEPLRRRRPLPHDKQWKRVERTHPHQHGRVHLSYPNAFFKIENWPGDPYTPHPRL